MFFARFSHNSILKFGICFYGLLPYPQIIGLSGKSCTHFICRIATYPVDKVIRSLNDCGQAFSKGHHAGLQMEPFGALKDSDL